MTSVVAPSFCRLVAPGKRRVARGAWLIALGGLSLHCGNRDLRETHVPETPRVTAVVEVPVVPDPTSSPSPPSVPDPPPRGAATEAQLWGKKKVFAVIDGDAGRKCLSLQFEPRDDMPTKGDLRLYLDRLRHLNYSVEGSEIHFRFLWEYKVVQDVEVEEGVDCRSTSHVESKGGWLLLDGAKLFDSKEACVERASDTQPLPRRPPDRETYEVASWCWAFL